MGGRGREHRHKLRWWICICERALNSLRSRQRQRLLPISGWWLCECLPSSIALNWSGFHQILLKVSDFMYIHLNRRWNRSDVLQFVQWKNDSLFFRSHLILLWRRTEECNLYWRLTSICSSFLRSKTISRRWTILIVEKKCHNFSSRLHHWQSTKLNAIQIYFSIIILLWWMKWKIGYFISAREKVDSGYCIGFGIKKFCWRMGNMIKLFSEHSLNLISVFFPIGVQFGMRINNFGDCII